MLSVGRPARIHGIIAMILGALLLVTGIGAWIFVSNSLRAQGVSVSAGGSNDGHKPNGFIGTWPSENCVGREGKPPVAGPITAMIEADLLRCHVGIPVSKLSADQFTDTPATDTAPAKTAAENYAAAKSSGQIGAFLQASLFTSVLAFGVSLLTAGLGLLFLIVGHAILRLSPRYDDGAVGYAPAAAGYAPVAAGVTYSQVPEQRVAVAPETVTTYETVEEYNPNA